VLAAIMPIFFAQRQTRKESLSVSVQIEESRGRESH
jgi:hypothetical protein